MARAFHRNSSGGDIVVGLDSTERRLLTVVFSSLITLLTGDEEPETPAVDSDGDAANDVPTAAQLNAMFGMDRSGEAPTDPALRRLFPDVDPQDRERSEEFRRYTEQGLRDSKVANIQTVLLTLGRSDPLTLAHSEALAWLAALNDMRLVTAVRLGIETEDDWERIIGSEEPSDDMSVTIYDFLSWLQESLVTTLMKDLG